MPLVAGKAVMAVYSLPLISDIDAGSIEVARNEIPGNFVMICD
jgi:hypothetical protein